MNDQVDPKAVAAFQAMDAAGQAKYGESWARVVTIADRVKPKGGVAQEVLGSDDPPAALVRTTRELLLQASDSGDTEAEKILRETRTAERKSWRESKGLR